MFNFFLPYIHKRWKFTFNFLTFIIENKGLEVFGVCCKFLYNVKLRQVKSHVKLIFLYHGCFRSYNKNNLNLSYFINRRKKRRNYAIKEICGKSTLHGSFLRLATLKVTFSKKKKKKQKIYFLIFRSVLFFVCTAGPVKKPHKERKKQYPRPASRLTWILTVS